MESLYPSGPDVDLPQIAHPDGQYRRHAWLAVISLITFLLLYLLLAIWFGYTAFRLFAASAAGSEQVGLNFFVGACAGFLSAFMWKALFFIKRGRHPDMVETHAAESPQLFEFLNRLADEAGAPRPARVFLSARVNAAVFYDISLLNLIFPSRKNLEIGLPLVNVLTLSELKAVLAHEFGHFAQRSMAIGSWVYIGHQIAAHLVAKRDAFDAFLSRLSRLDFRFAWIGWVLSLIVWSIRSVLDSMFTLVLLAQRALSRQMEFQADLVAVSLTGSDELVHALHKLKAADHAWQTALNLGMQELKQGRKLDIFALQDRVIERVGRVLVDENYGRTPELQADADGSHRIFFSNFSLPPQMWSTHPANADREENAKKYYLRAPHDSRSAWLLFGECDDLKTRVMAKFYAQHEAVPVDEQHIERVIDGIYKLAHYDARYLGCYVNRSLTRYASEPTQLYSDEVPRDDIESEIAALYPASLSTDITRLKALDEELVLLRAILERQFKAAGGEIIHRGRPITRIALPRVIEAVAAETEQVRMQVQSHDLRCRTVHRAAAAALGRGWPEYLAGLVAVLHYAEHTYADLYDAHGQFVNALAVVTAGRTVRKSELPGLLAIGNMLHDVLRRIYVRKDEIQLDETLLAKLNVTHWCEILEEFKLQFPEEANINSWVRVIDGWVMATGNALAALTRVSLEQLLVSEQRIALAYADHLSTPPHVVTVASSELGDAPAPSRIQAEYARLIPGSERTRQLRLHWWDRFRVADGLIPALGRFAVAAGLIGAVLGIGSTAATTSQLSIYNGLGRPVVVDIAGQHFKLAAFSASTVTLPVKAVREIDTRTTDGVLIETLKPVSDGYYGHRIYNVAQASPLIAWKAVYGSYPKSDAVLLGNPGWLERTADVYFSDPPTSIQADAGGGSRSVLSGVGALPPETQLQLLKDPQQQILLIAAHARWDLPQTPYADEWRRLARHSAG